MNPHPEPFPPPSPQHFPDQTTPTHQGVEHAARLHVRTEHLVHRHAGHAAAAGELGGGRHLQVCINVKGIWFDLIEGSVSVAW